jgi:membrane protein DedA with SNARE-associated domain
VPDITAPLVNFATDAIGSYGWLAVFLLMVLESACIPVPSEAIMLYGGFLVSQGDADLVGIVAAGVLGNVLGSWIAYWLGRAKGRDWLLSWRWLHVTPARLAAADRWFARWGDWAVLVSRCLPIIRTFISLPAGIARMPFGRFTLLTLVGCLPWVLALALAGRAVGDNWETLQRQLHYLDYALILAVVAGVAWWIVRRRRRSRHAVPRPPRLERDGESRQAEGTRAPLAAEPGEG